MTTEPVPAETAPPVSSTVASRWRVPLGLARRALPAGWPAFAPAALTGLVAVIWVTYVQPLVHFDIDVFLRAGAAVAAGRDPYPRPGSADVSSGFAFVYPYLVAFPFAPLARLPRAGAEAVFIGLSVLAVLAGCRLAGARRWLLYALVLGASCTIIGLQMGTLNAVLFAGLAALWRLRDRPVLAGVVAALLVYSKLFLVPVPLWLLLAGRRRAAAVAVGTLGVLFGVGELLSPVGLETYGDMLNVLARAEAPAGLSLTGLLMNVGLGLGWATWTARAVAIALFVACCAHGRRPAPRRALAVRAGGDERLLFAAAVAAALLASPIVWSHYLLLLAAPLLVLEGGERAGALATATVVSWLLVTPHLSTLPDLVVSALVLAALAARPLGDAVRRAAALHGPGRLVALAVPAALVGLPALAGLELCWALARTHQGGDAVTGAYLVTLCLLALPVWAARQLRSPPARPGALVPVDALEPQPDDD